MKIASYSPKLTTGLTYETGQNTLSIPYAVGDAQADFDGITGGCLLLVNTEGKTRFIEKDSSDTFTVAYRVSDILITWKDQLRSIGDTDDVTFITDVLKAGAIVTGGPYQNANDLLTAIAALAPTVTDRIIYTTGVNTVGMATLTAFARDLLDDASASDARTTLGLGSMATQDASAVNISGGTIDNTAITGLPAPSAANDAASKNYVDNLVSGAKWKSSVRAASTADVNVASAPASIDGVTLNINDRVLLLYQSAPEENGIYVFASAGAALTRATDADSWTEIVSAVVSVDEGSTNADRQWICTDDAGGILGVTAITFVEFNAAVPSASETVAGKVELANNAEAVAGTSDTVVNTPLKTEAQIVGKSRTYTEPQRADNATDNDGSFDMNSKNDFVCTPAGAVAIAFTNTTNGQRGMILLDNAGGHAITKGSGVIADSEFEITVSAAGKYLISYWCYDGTNVALSYSQAIS